MRAMKTRARKGPNNNSFVGRKAREVLTAPEAAEYLRVSENVLLRLASAQEVPGRKIGGEWRFLKSALQDWLAAASPRKGLLSQVGALKDDPHREELLKEIYARRGRPEVEER